MQIGGYSRVTGRDTGTKMYALHNSEPDTAVISVM